MKDWAPNTPRFYSLIDESRPVNSELIKLGLKPLKQVQDAMQHCLEHNIGILALGLLEFL